MEKIIIQLPIKLKTLTAKEFINRYSVCQEAERWLRKLGVNKPMEFYWNRCARRGWLQYYLWRDFTKEWQKIQHLLDNKHDAFGRVVNHHQAERFRNAIEIEWI